MNKGTIIKIIFLPEHLFLFLWSLDAASPLAHVAISDLCEVEADPLLVQLSDWETLMLSVLWPAACCDVAVALSKVEVYLCVFCASAVVLLITEVPATAADDWVVSDRELIWKQEQSNNFI